MQAAAAAEHFAQSGDLILGPGIHAQVAALVLAAWQPPLLLYLALHVGLLWLVRALYHYASVLSALADLGLNGMALAAAVWASTHTASLLLSTWCFFLVQALFVAIPRDLRDRRVAQGAPTAPADRFQQAHRAAQGVALGEIGREARNMVEQRQRKVECGIIGGQIGPLV